VNDARDAVVAVAVGAALFVGMVLLFVAVLSEPLTGDALPRKLPVL
jgi:hypothetical protein